MSKLLIRAKTCSCTPGSRIVKHTQIRAQLSIRANTYGGVMTESPEALRHAHSCSALDTGPHLPDHAQPPTRTSKCRYIPSSAHMQKRPALNTGQHIKILRQPSINAERSKKMTGPKHVQTHADTLSVLDVCRHTLKHVWFSKRANTRRYTLCS